MRSYCSVRLMEEMKASVHNLSFLDINHFLSERFFYDFRSMFSRASLVPLSQKSFTSAISTFCLVRFCLELEVRHNVFSDEFETMQVTIISSSITSGFKEGNG